MIRPPPISTLFPYTTLFRSERLRPGGHRHRCRCAEWGARRSTPGSVAAATSSLCPQHQTPQQPEPPRARFDTGDRIRQDLVSATVGAAPSFESACEGRRPPPARTVAAVRERTRASGTGVLA